MRDDIVNLGLITNLSAFEKPGQSDTVLLMGRSREGEQWTRLVTRGTAQALWFYLVRILFPRAAEQLTPRMATAALRDLDTPMVTTAVKVHGDETAQLIYVLGFGGRQNWLIHFTYEEGRELWASLEDVLNSVGGRLGGDRLP